ncbi:hypothetical protein G6045_21185 [Streptomyces sp. YC504]|uniref:Lipoprotein n=1 Tax=Streptomyces mesophilus TaxID=1775132 RepID=A0A6G4XMW6_9ACTN|nr:hypothetical protein [Streptomyces mesophilus]NGO78160.1 hypothetical protein [Streptomyces mesophilus]
MRTAIVRRTVLLLPLALVAALAACGDERAGGAGDRSRMSPPAASAAPHPRAQEVAAAWSGSGAAEQWAAGYHPMSPIVQLPDGGFHSAADRLAYGMQSARLDGELPATAPPSGQARFADGTTLTRPHIPARAAFRGLFGSFDDKHHLTVTGVEPGRMTLESSRGPVTVPAWLFTLKGYDTPLKRAALDPSKLPEPPIGPARGLDPGELGQVQQVLKFSVDARTLTVLSTHGDCDDGPRVAVFEDGDSVVLSGSVAGVKTDGPCTTALRIKKVTVRLDRPVGDRVLLDASTGRPVPYGEGFGRSPTWS